MKKGYDAIIVGGGMAGLTAAAYLCREGYRTLLCERSSKIGGLVNTFWQDGFAFDAGLRAVENSGIVLPMLKSLGIEVEFAQNPVMIGIGEEQVRLRSRDSLAEYAAMLKTVFPDSAADIDTIITEIEKVMGYMDVLYGIENPLFLDNLKDPEYLRNTLLPWFLKYQVNIRKAERLNEPINTYLMRFTANRALIDLIAQHFFKNTPAFFALSYFGLYLDYSYPMGGTSVLAEQVADYIRLNGGEIRTESPVTAVDLAKHEVRLADQETLRYRKLIWAADQKALYARASGQESSKITKQRALVEQGRGGDSVLTLYLASDLEKDYFAKHSTAHTFYTPAVAGLHTLPSWQQAAVDGTDALLEWLAQYLAYTTYEISIPVLRDSSLAPEGRSGLIISTLLDYDLVRFFTNADRYGEFKSFASAKMAEVLDRSLYPGLLDHIQFSLCSTPFTLARESGNSDGAITGWAFGSGAMPSESRFRKIARSIRTPFDDVYQCGQWSFSPSGMPVSILTGKLAADAVKKDFKGKRS